MHISVPLTFDWTSGFSEEAFDGQQNMGHYQAHLLGVIITFSYGGLFVVTCYTTVLKKQLLSILKVYIPAGQELQCFSTRWRFWTYIYIKKKVITRS